MVYVITYCQKADGWGIWSWLFFLLRMNLKVARPRSSDCVCVYLHVWCLHGLLFLLLSTLSQICLEIINFFIIHLFL